MKKILFVFLLISAGLLAWNSWNRSMPIENEPVLLAVEAGTPVDRTISELYDECMENHEAKDYQRVVCLLPYFENVTLEKNATVALEEARNLKSNGTINECHLPAHSIGAANLKKHDYDLGKTFSSCPLGCFEGCFHGAFEALAEKRGNIEDLVTAGPIPEICTTVGENRKETLHCVHGIGHGLMRHKDSRQMITNIEICQRITDLDYRTGCLSGVIMENMNNFLELPPADLKSALPNICDPIKNSSKYSDLMWLCIEEISDGLMSYTGADRAEASKYCAVLPSEIKKQCLEGIEGFRDTDAEVLHNE